jgi:hypothetical protein
MHRAYKATRAAAANDRIIVQSLKRFNKEAWHKRMPPLHDFDVSGPRSPKTSPPACLDSITPHLSHAPMRLSVSKAQEDLYQYQLKLIYWQLRLHGVPPHAPIHAQLKLNKDLATYSRLRESHPSCSARILLRSFKLVWRTWFCLVDHSRNPYISYCDVQQRVFDSASKRVLEWLLARKKLMLVLMAHGRGPPMAATEVHLFRLPFKILVMILKQSLY